jgi:glutamate 5-kinase
LNVRNTLWELLDFGVIPVINENDTVSVEELMPTFGDNDRLAALVTALLRAPLLVILSDVQGLYTGDPADANSTLISTVHAVDEAVKALVRDKATGLSKGGMASKLEAVRIVTTSGENAIIASGRDLQVLTRVMAGEEVGTLFMTQGKPVSPWKRWIAFSSRTRGKLHLDAGAARAIVHDGRSLLAIGIRAAEGDFEKGDIVAVFDPQGKEIARGLTNYSQRDVEHIKGLKSSKIAQVLGYCPYEEVIHRDNLALLGVGRA